MIPTELKSGGTALIVRFAVGECSLGSVLVAATDRGVCAVLLGDDPEALKNFRQVGLGPGPNVGSGASIWL